jgi:hypothetical protein
MAVYTSDHTHEAYTRINRHWCSESEKWYTGADSLLTAQRRGWTMTGTIYYEQVRLTLSRRTTIYHVMLMRNGNQKMMPVVCNPFMQRLVEKANIQLYPYREFSPDESTVPQVEQILNRLIG